MQIGSATQATVSPAPASRATRARPPCGRTLRRVLAADAVGTASVTASNFPPLGARIIAATLGHLPAPSQPSSGSPRLALSYHWAPLCSAENRNFGKRERP